MRLPWDCDDVLCTNRFYSIKSGTSFAAPLASGAAALLWSQTPELSPSQVHNRLVERAGILTTSNEDLRLYTEDPRMVNKRLLDINWALSAPDNLRVLPASPSVHEDCRDIPSNRIVAQVASLNSSASSSFSLLNSVPFSIDANTGEIFADGNNSQCPFNFEIAQNYELTVRVENENGSSFVESFSIEVLEVPSLTSLSIEDVTLDQSFNSQQLNYTANVSYLHSNIRINASASSNQQQVRINDMLIEQGQPSHPIYLNPNNDNRITVTVTNTAGNALQTYTLFIFRQDGLNASYQKASDIQSNDNYGSALANDETTLVVGAPGRNNDSGVIFITDLNGTSNASLSAPNASAGIQFGNSVAISNNVIAVGAPGESNNTQTLSDANSNTPDAGAVYIFTRSNNIWTLSDYLKAPNPVSGDHFGSQLAFNNNRLIISAPFTDIDDKSDAGAVYISEFDGTNWVISNTLTASDSESGDQFGHAIAPEENILAISAIGKDKNDVMNAGGVYVYQYNDTIWEYFQTLYATHSDTDDAFGSAIAIDKNIMAISATGEDSAVSSSGATNVVNNDSSNSGAVYIFENINIWEQTGFIKASNANTEDHFGASISLDNGRLAIGAPREDSLDRENEFNNGNGSNTNSGATYFYSYFNNQWNKERYIKASLAVAGQSFGAKTIMHDGSLIISAPNDNSGNPDSGFDNTATDSGAIYIFK